MKTFGFRGRRVRWWLGVLLACPGMPAIAANYMVTTSQDTGAGSLRQAMLTAMASPEADTITFAPSGRVTSANISGPPFAGTPTGGCIAAALRKARVPAFDGDRVTVSKTIVIQ